MTLSRLARRFRIRGVFWRQLLEFGIRNTPLFLELPIMTAFTLFFFVLWRSGRRSVMANLRAIDPSKSWLANLVSAFRVFLNFAWTFTETGRFNSERIEFDWELTGFEHLHRLTETGEGAILLTAHMGNYDLGSYIFSERLGRRITIVRAPETDEETEQHATRMREALLHERFRVHYNTSPATLAVELVEAIRGGEVVAIQGDRIVSGLTGLDIELFGRPTHLPAGPFGLAMVTRAPIYPVFIMRAGYRRYRVVGFPPMHVERRNRDRDEAILESMSHWRTLLESVVREHREQWFAFDRFYRQPRHA